MRKGEIAEYLQIIGGEGLSRDHQLCRSRVDIAKCAKSMGLELSKKQSTVRAIRRNLLLFEDGMSAYCCCWYGQLSCVVGCSLPRRRFGWIAVA